MKASIAKKKFKDRFGQANHFLITALVGVDGIKSGIITKKPDSFSTMWNPISTVRSAERTRVFILKSFLGWAVESLEMYLTELNRKPKLLDSEKFSSLFSSAGQSVYQKTILIGKETKVDPILIALMEVLITWRNYTFHYDIDNQISTSSMNCLLENKETVKKLFSGLEISQLKSTWEKGCDFSFKETASLIKATQDFVTAIDTYVLQNLNYQRYYTEVVQIYFENNKKGVTKYKSLSQEKKKKYLKVLLQNIVGTKEDEIENTVLDSIIINLK